MATDGFAKSFPSTRHDGFTSYGGGTGDTSPRDQLNHGSFFLPILWPMGVADHRTFYPKKWWGNRVVNTHVYLWEVHHEFWTIPLGRSRWTCKWWTPKAVVKNPRNRIAKGSLHHLPREMIIQAHRVAHDHLPLLMEPVAPPWGFFLRQGHMWVEVLDGLSIDLV